MSTYSICIRCYQHGPTFINMCESCTYTRFQYWQALRDPGSHPNRGNILFSDSSPAPFPATFPAPDNRHAFYGSSPQSNGQQTYPSPGYQTGHDNGYLAPTNGPVFAQPPAPAHTQMEYDDQPTDSVDIRRKSFLQPSASADSRMEYCNPRTTSVMRRDPYDRSSTRADTRREYDDRRTGSADMRRDPYDRRASTHLKRDGRAASSHHSEDPPKTNRPAFHFRNKPAGRPNAAKIGKPKDKPRRRGPKRKPPKPDSPASTKDPNTNPSDPGEELQTRVKMEGKPYVKVEVDNWLSVPEHAHPEAQSSFQKPKMGPKPNDMSFGGFQASLRAVQGCR